MHEHLHFLAGLVGQQGSCISIAHTFGTLTCKHCTAADCTAAGKGGSSSGGGTAGKAGTVWPLTPALPFTSDFPAAAPLPAAEAAAACGATGSCGASGCKKLSSTGRHDALLVVVSFGKRVCLTCSDATRAARSCNRLVCSCDDCGLPAHARAAAAAAALLSSTGSV